MHIFENFNLENELRKRGRKICGKIPLFRKPDGSPIYLPIMMAIGEADGPVLVADSCAHGEEYEGMEGINRTFRQLDVSKMKGSFIGIPVANVEAFNEQRRYTGIDFVPLDMNRIFPGSPNGSVTMQLTHFYYTEILKKADVVVVIHGGGNYLYLNDIGNYIYTKGVGVSEKNKELAEVFGFKSLWCSPAGKASPGCVDGALFQDGIPCLTAEIGGQSTRVNHREEQLLMLETGLFNLMKLYKIIDGEIAKSEGQYYVYLEYIRCKNGGVQTPMKKGGERVKKGETLCIIRDIFGEEIERVLAPYDGIVIGYWAYSIVQPCSWTYMYGKEIIE